MCGLENPLRKFNHLIDAIYCLLLYSSVHMYLLWPTIFQGKETKLIGKVIEMNEYTSEKWFVLYLRKLECL